jgi:hypothetical protein
MKHNYDDLEKEMINFKFEDLETDIQTSKKAFAANATIADSRLCEIWRKIRKFIKPLVSLPVVGKFVAILVEVLDSICPS